MAILFFPSTEGKINKYILFDDGPTGSLEKEKEDKIEIEVSSVDPQP